MGHLETSVALVVLIAIVVLIVYAGWVTARGIIKKDK